MGIKEKMANIVGAENVNDSAEILRSYSSDKSLQPPKTPSLVVAPHTTEQVREILKTANEEKIPVTPRSSKVGFYGAGIPADNGIVVDLSRMNRILTIDPENKRVQVEPGVTYAQIYETLSKEGLQVCGPLMAHPEKSVLTSSLERDVILTTRQEYTETFETACIVMADGNLIRTGSAIGEGITSGIYPDGAFPGTYLYKGAQGTLGVVTWANIKMEWLPLISKTVIITADRCESLIDPMYRILYKQVGRECFILNRTAMAAIFPESNQEKLPAYGLFLTLSGEKYFPEEKIAYQEEALREIQEELGFTLEERLPENSIDLTTFADKIRAPWPDPQKYWKEGVRGGFADIFFISTLEKLPEIHSAIEVAVKNHQYSIDEISFYIQPIEYGRTASICYTIFYEPDSASEKEKVRSLYEEMSRSAMDKGALFSNPYGIWADMVYDKAENYKKVLTLVKDAFDPNNTLNPDRLCFSSDV